MRVCLGFWSVLMLLYQVHALRGKETNVLKIIDMQESVGKVKVQSRALVNMVMDLQVLDQLIACRPFKLDSRLGG